MQFKGVDVAQGSVTIEPDKGGNVGELHTGKADVQAFLYIHTHTGIIRHPSGIVELDLPLERSISTLWISHTFS